MMNESQTPSPEDLSHRLQGIIKTFCLKSPENSLKSETNEKAWDEPLVGFSNGSDPLYLQLKEDIGLFYWTPIEIFEMTFPEVTASPADLTVIRWVLPPTTVTKAAHRKETVYPSERWLSSRLLEGSFTARLR